MYVCMYVCNIWQDWKPQLAGGNQLAIYKRGRRFELETADHKYSPASGQSGTRTRDRRIPIPTRWALCHAAFP